MEPKIVKPDEQTVEQVTDVDDIDDSQKIADLGEAAQNPLMMIIDLEKKVEEVGNEKGDDTEKEEYAKDEDKDEHILVARDTMESKKGMQKISNIDFIQGPINLNSLSLVQELKFVAITQAKASEDLLKSHTEEKELISLTTSFLKKILPSFKQDTLDSPFGKLRSMVKLVDSHFESLEKATEVKALSHFNAKRLRTVLRMVEGDRISLITGVKGIQEALDKGGKIYKSCLLLLKFTIELDKKIKECEGKLINDEDATPKVAEKTAMERGLATKGKKKKRAQETMVKKWKKDKLLGVTLREPVSHIIVSKKQKVKKFKTPAATQKISDIEEEEAPKRDSPEIPSPSSSTNEEENKEQEMSPSEELSEEELEGESREEESGDVAFYEAGKVAHDITQFMSEKETRDAAAEQEEYAEEEAPIHSGEIEIELIIGDTPNPQGEKEEDYGSKHNPPSFYWALVAIEFCKLLEKREEWKKEKEMLEEKLKKDVEINKMEDRIDNIASLLPQAMECRPPPRFPTQEERPAAFYIRRIEKGKAKISDFADVIGTEIDTSVQPPSPPRETFKDDEVTEVLMDLDWTTLLVVVLEEDANDERIIASIQFMVDDNFVNTPEFKSFWMREKMKKLFEEEIQNFDKSGIHCTPQEAKEFVKKSDIILISGWDLEKIFVNHDKMYIENVKLKKEIAAGEATKLPNQQLEEMQRMQDELQNLKEESKNRHMEIKKAMVLQMANKVLSKLDEVHSSYSSVIQFKSHLDEILSFFFLLRVMWFPKGPILKEILLAIKNMPNSPPAISTTWNN
ncbi:uncharacterized protein LOC131857687 [Cryptomeria japonica]|uniref:uncharacterized protein LOC131857687 n=1 Tax=Cryptomeria japonica TaxID=3369 RepID=UPI0027DAB4FD|nr:uncharacterized protein LOC131857687 [Cryptomeria japonica]